MSTTAPGAPEPTTGPTAQPSERRQPWKSPAVIGLPKLTELTLLSPIGGGGGIGGSTVFGLLLAVGLLFGIGACSDGIVRPSAPTRPAPAIQTVSCRADVRAGTIACAGPETTSGSVTLGGQGTRVLLRSSNVAYDNVTHIFSADVTLQNLLAQTLLGGTDVFFESGPTVTGGTGVVTVANPTGLGAFDATNQPFFQYPDSIRFDQVSPSLNWQWNVPGTVTTFAFTVLVSADVADQGGVLFWSEIPQFHSAGLTDIAVNSSTDAMAVGPFGEVLHKVGNRWTEPPVQYFGEWAGIAAIGGGKYIGATTSGNVVIFDGQVWKLVRNAGFTIAGVTAYAADRIAIGGDSGGSGHVSWLGDNGWFSIGIGGGSFSFLASYATDQGVAADSAGSVYRFNFNSPTPSGNSGSPITALYGAVGKNDYGYNIFSGGSGILDGGTIEIYGSATADTTIDAIDFGSGGPNWWAAARSITTDSSMLMSWTGGVWSNRAALPAQVTRMIQDSAGGLYLLSADGIRRWNGSSIVDELVTSTADYPTALAAVGSRAAVGTVQGNVRQYVSGSWVTSDPDGAAADSVIGLQLFGTDSILVAEGESVKRFDGTSWSDFGGAIGVPISAFWAPNSGQAVVALLGPDIVYRQTAPGDLSNGTADPGGGPPGQFRAEWGTSINDFWLVGDGGRVVWYDSTAGYVVESPGPTQDLDAVTGTSSTNVWVGGTNGYIAHWNGSGWTDCSLPTSETITSLWISADGTVYAGTFAADTLQNFPCNVRVPTITTGVGAIRALRGSSANQLWALVGNDLFEGQR
ncbi:MAG TPA: hypothetical protein VFI39_10015 [Gemmatimonadales bacterium]|nr:hypothetical protein [Gemmatimonadales bacterium]